MLHKSYLFNSQEPDVLLSKPVFKGLPASFIRLDLVVPRQLCTHFRISCAGVPRLRLAAFAQLQVQAMAPFVHYGTYVIHQGNWLHAWVWDAAIETAFSNKHGSEHRFHALPYSLYSTPVANGVVWLASPSHQGIEAQLWQNKQLIDSQWFDTPPSEANWADLRALTPELESTGWPVTLPTPNAAQTCAIQPRPWGSNLIPRKHLRYKINWTYIVPSSLVIATAGLAGWGAWLYSQKETYQQAITLGIKSQERRLAELEPIQKARQRTQQTLMWVNAANALAPAPTTSDILNELANIVTRQGLLVRELEITPPTMQATLVATTGGSPRLTAVLGALENHPWFQDARFVDVSGGSGFKFSWRMRPTTATTNPGQP